MDDPDKTLSSILAEALLLFATALDVLMAKTG
jgi:hypothetical protein